MTSLYRINYTAILYIFILGDIAIFIREKISYSFLTSNLGIPCFNVK